MNRLQTYRRAFTLVELLVVVSIVGLLAVAVLPALGSGGNRRLLRGAAERVDTHLKRAAAVATGKARGEAVWLEADAGTAVVLDLNFARVHTGASGTTSSVSLNTAGDVATLSGDIATLCRDVTPNSITAGSLVFPMVPTEFRILNGGQIRLTGTQSIYNTAFPSGLNEFTAYPPPSGPRITSRPTLLPEKSCIDLSSSTIGVYGFGEYKVSGSPTPLDTYSAIAIRFDNVGRPIEVWGDPSAATPTPHFLAPGTPIALLVTTAGDAGAGTGWSNPDALWVVIDPKSGRNLLVPNKFQPTDLADAQSFIVDDLAP